MIYAEPATMGWKPLSLIWLSELPEYFKDQISLITALFEWTLPPLFVLVRKKLKEYVLTQDIQLCVSVMRIFCMLFQDALSDETAAKDNMKHVRNWTVVSRGLSRCRTGTYRCHPSIG